MVSLNTIAVAAVLQLLGISFFVPQPKDQCSPAPAVGSYLFLVATLVLFWDSDMIPKKLHIYSPWILAGGDLFFTILFTELFVLLGWCGFERITYVTVQIVCKGNMWCEYGLMTFCTILGAFASLTLVVGMVCQSQMKDSVAEIIAGLPVPKGCGPVYDFFLDMHTYVIGCLYFCQLSRKDRLLSIRAFEMQVLRSKVQQRQQRKQAGEPAGQEDSEK
ncbi:uncharacterized protein LOC108110625 [Drosophila eugracilis]|uniref:uncharacterized protein LOC108110625 n=1 Tax=Drosophila eugracilis TaxID=29029 RepID=UPI001BD9B3A3|nr:uncharacterized protein LOC108110625 [Drosophila eugracilis]